MAHLARARHAPAAHVRRARVSRHGEHPAFTRYEPPAARCNSPAAHLIDEATGGRSNESTHLCPSLVLPNPCGWAGRRAAQGRGRGGDPATPGFLQRPWAPAPLPPSTSVGPHMRLTNDRVRSPPAPRVILKHCYKARLAGKEADMPLQIVPSHSNANSEFCFGVISTSLIHLCRNLFSCSFPHGRAADKRPSNVTLITLWQ